MYLQILKKMNHEGNIVTLTMSLQSVLDCQKTFLKKITQ